jgi:hypothetical protein
MATNHTRACSNGVVEAFVTALRTKLPEATFDACVERLTRNQNVMSVARFLMTQPRGRLEHVGLPTLRKYLTELKKLVDQRRKSKPLIATSVLQDELRQHAENLQNRAAVEGVQLKNKAWLDKVSDEIDGVYDWINAKRVLTVAFVKVMREVEHAAVFTSKLPLPVDSNMKLLAELRRIGEALGRLEAKHQISGSDKRGARLGEEQDSDAMAKVWGGVTTVAANGADAAQNKRLREIIDRMNPHDYDETVKVAKMVAELSALVAEETNDSGAHASGEEPKS